MRLLLQALSSAFKFSAMVDLLQTAVCCLCGDVGFPTELFRCVKCCNRFQHSYCSNYYGESADPIEWCDWCQSEERSGRTHGDHRGSARISAANDDVRVPNRRNYSGNKSTQRRRDDSSERAKNSGGVPSPRPSTRRYKLLKDVMC